jgi:hypothetical protein
VSLSSIVGRKRRGDALAEVVIDLVVAVARDDRTHLFQLLSCLITLGPGVLETGDLVAIPAE